MNQFEIRRVLIERGAENDSLSKRIIEKLHNIPIEIVESNDLALREDIEEMDKNSLRLIHYKGEFLKPCPGTRRYICCGYQILNVGINCPMVNLSITTQIGYSGLGLESLPIASPLIILQDGLIFYFLFFLSERIAY
jgi:hypothetical protein